MCILPTQFIRIPRLHIQIVSQIWQHVSHWVGKSKHIIVPVLLYVSYMPAKHFAREFDRSKSGPIKQAIDIVARRKSRNISRILWENIFSKIK